jgi:hypothetical protein
MSQDRGADSNSGADPNSVEKPAAEAPDGGKAFDPAMTDEDEANIPPDSEADPNASTGAG